MKLHLTAMSIGFALFIALGATIWLLTEYVWEYAVPTLCLLAGSYVVGRAAIEIRGLRR